jgi:hypothetical protein
VRDLIRTAFAVLTFAAVMALLTVTARGDDDPPPLAPPDPAPLPLPVVPTLPAPEPEKTLTPESGRVIRWNGTAWVYADKAPEAPEAAAPRPFVGRSADFTPATIAPRAELHSSTFTAGAAPTARTLTNVLRVGQFGVTNCRSPSG